MGGEEEGGEEGEIGQINKNVGEWGEWGEGGEEEVWRVWGGRRVWRGCWGVGGQYNWCKIILMFP